MKTMASIGVQLNQKDQVMDQLGLLLKQASVIDMESTIFFCLAPTHQISLMYHLHQMSKFVENGYFDLHVSIVAM